MEDNNIEPEDVWFMDLPMDAAIAVCKGFIDNYNNVEKEVGYPVAEEFMGPVHTWFSDIMYTFENDRGGAEIKALSEKF